MNFKEATEWLLGEKSMTNLIPQDPFDTWQVRIAKADSAMMCQAYWFLRSYKEGLILQQVNPADVCQHPLSSIKPVRVCHICGENLDVRR